MSQRVPPPPAPPLNVQPAESSDEAAPRRNGYSVELVQQGRNARLEVMQREKSQPELLRDELNATLGRKERGVALPTRLPAALDVVISESSSGVEVVDWLESKGFSIRTLQVLDGQTGATIFALSKRQLQDYCGKEEGQRLYSQLLVQKNMTGYSTKSGAELKAILNARKKRADSAGGAAESNGQLSTLFEAGPTTQQF